MARFWTVALGYVEAPPPEGWDSWEAWLRHFQVPEDEWTDGTLLEDPQGVLPSIGFLQGAGAQDAQRTASTSTSRSPAAATSTRTSARS